MSALDKINVPDFERPIVELEIKLDQLMSTLHLVRNHEEKEAKEEEIQHLKAEINKALTQTFEKLKPWQLVQLARHPQRPLFGDYLESIFDDFTELHGDRAFGDDPAITCGFASIEGHKVLLVGHRKGKTLKERIQYNFGCAHPEGYRKSILKMKLAEKSSLPIISLINTPGAYPGLEAEERGQSMAIAEAIRDMSALRTPIICVTIGEGGSGGALGIGVGDRYLIMENAYYSVISPEGCAAILWHDGKKAEEAANVLKLTPQDTVRLGIMDQIVSEPQGGAHRNPLEAGKLLKTALVQNLVELKAKKLEDLLEERYQKLRGMGEYKLVQL